jgi:imidazolonepropionase-like amidohydrolase
MSIKLNFLVTVGLATGWASATSAPGSPSHRAIPAVADSVILRDTLRIYYVGYGVGYERYEVARSADGYRYSADVDYIDRGRRTHTGGTVVTGRDYAIRHLEITRLTDTSSVITTAIDVDGAQAHITVRDKRTDVPLPRVRYAIEGRAPLVQHIPLLRYWLAHGEPRTLVAASGDSAGDLTIERKGRDTLSLSGRRIVLDRYSVDGVVWGAEAVWLDQSGRLAAFASGNGLSYEAVRLELEPLHLQLMAIATRDRLADLARISKKVHPIASGTVALVGATLIDGTGRDAIPNATVVVRGGRIVAAGPSANVTIPAGAQRVDVTGKTVMPGLWDMHTHVLNVEWAPVYLASGATTIRDMGNIMDFIVAFRAAVNAGKGLGPHMVLAGLVDGGGPNAFGAQNATTPDEGRAVVRRYHELGFEQMKLYDLLKPDVVGAITAEAHRLGMTVTGHVPRALGLIPSIDSGMDHVAHQPIRGDTTTEGVRQIIDTLRAHGTVMDPTVAWGEILNHSTAEPTANLIPGVVNLPPVLRRRYLTMGSATVDPATAHERIARTLGIVNWMYKAGVPIVPGTDQGVPGFSLYREIELYAAAGMTRMDALRSATAVSARAMRMDGEVGTLEAGKRADLIALDGNPLDAIENVSRVRLVMKDGVLYRTADIWKAVGFGVPQ